MLIRPAIDSDLPELRAIHARQQFDYAFPDLNDPLFLTKLVLVDGKPGQGTDASQTAIAGAALLRLTAEAYLLLDPEKGSPRERWQRLVTLHEATRRDALARGLADVHAWLPPRIAQKFGRRLQQLGWIRDDTWTPFCKRLR